MRRQSYDKIVQKWTVDAVDGADVLFAAATTNRTRARTRLVLIPLLPVRCLSTLVQHLLLSLLMSAVFLFVRFLSPSQVILGFWVSRSLSLFFDFALLSSSHFAPSLSLFWPLSILEFHHLLGIVSGLFSRLHCRSFNEFDRWSTSFLSQISYSMNTTSLLRRFANLRYNISFRVHVFFYIARSARVCVYLRTQQVKTIIDLHFWAMVCLCVFSFFVFYPSSLVASHYLIIFAALIDQLLSINLSIMFRRVRWVCIKIGRQRVYLVVAVVRNRKWNGFFKYMQQLCYVISFQSIDWQFGFFIFSPLMMLI